MDRLILIDKTCFEGERKVNESGTTSVVVQLDTNEKYVKKIITNIKPSVHREELISFCESLRKPKYPCFMTPSYIYFDDHNLNILYHYKANQSLKDLLYQINQNDSSKSINEIQKIKILYGVSLFLEQYHLNKQTHGNLKLSNILLDEDYLPFVSDPILFQQFTKLPLNAININDNDNNPAEQSNNLNLLPSSDIFSFAIIMLELFTERNIETNNNDHESKENLLKEAKNMIIDASVPRELTDILRLCLFNDQKEIQTAANIKESLGKLLIKKINENNFKNFVDLISLKEEKINRNIIELQKKADGGDIDSIYKYGYCRYLGKYCPQNKEEGMNYIRYAVSKGYQKAQLFYDYFRKDGSNYIENCEGDEKIMHLIADSSFLKDFQLNDIENRLKKDFMKEQKFDFDKIMFERINFIPTEGALHRLSLLHKYIKQRVPVLIEGPTGTSKTISVEIVCKYLDKKLIRFNLSSDTKSSNLIGNYAGNPEKWSGLEMKNGPYLDAFKNGFVLLLDEINLANPECLQFINDTLDSDVISTELNGKTIKIKRHPNFMLIATQNPNKGLFTHKRKDLGDDFKSRFQTINFPEISNEELLLIAKGLAKKFKYEKEKIIEKLVEFHVQWSNSEIVQNDIQCFTIREISNTVKALSKGEPVFDTIMNIYGARYEKDKQEVLEKLLKKNYPCFGESKDTKFKYFDDFHDCFKSKNLSKAFKSILSSFENDRHVIVVSKGGNGVTFIARLFAIWYKNKYLKSSLASSEEYFFSCTSDTQCSDLIGKQRPSKDLNSSMDNNQLIQWIDGFLIRAISEGQVAVVDNIDEAQPTITERFNSLMDREIGSKFETPENANQRFVYIQKGFHLLCTCKLENLEQMSPAFINRFDVIVLEDQIERNEKELKELISILMIQAHKALKLTSQARKDEQNNDDQQYDANIEDEDSDSDNDDDDEGFHFKPIKKEESKNQEKIDPQYKMVDLIYSKLNAGEQKENKIMNNIDMFQLSQLCKAVTIFNDYFQGTIDEKSIIDFSIDLLDKNKEIEISDEIKNKLLSPLLENQKDEQYRSDDNSFFFEKSPSLQKLMALLFACSLINLPVCITGPTGAGKTSLAREFARIRPIETNRRNQKFLMHSFSSETKPKNIFGTATIKNGKIDFSIGTLLTSMTDGLTFIADEYNLSPISTMKSIAPALEPIDNHKLYISGVDEPIKVHPNFFLIACQNELGTIGRNKVPSPVASRFRYFDYPKQDIDDISLICVDIANSLYEENEEKSFSKEDAEKIGIFMYKLNELALKFIPHWSLRDIYKYFRRIHNQDIKPKTFRIKNNYRLDDKKMKLLMNLLFYTFAPIDNKEIGSKQVKSGQSIDDNGIFTDVLELIGKVFLSKNGETINDHVKEQLNDLRICFNENPKIIEDGNHNKYLKKGIFEISLPFLMKYDDQIESNLPSLLNGMFQILLSDPTEPILLMGPPGMKTFLSQQFLKDAKIITLNPESTVAQLLGSSAFFSKQEAKLFYIEYICRVCHLYEKIPIYIEQFKNGTLKEPQNKDEFQKEVNQIKTNLPKSFQYSITHLFEKLFDENKDDSNKCILSNLELEFRPGLFLWAILEGKSLILKDLSNLPTIVLERFNELFSGKHNLTINEDMHNTIVDDDNKELTNFDLNFRVFATCPPNSVSKLSEAVLSRFSVIWIPNYETTEQEIVLKSYVKLNGLKFDESFIKVIIDFSKKMNDDLGKSFSFPQIINAIEMCSRLNENQIINEEKCEDNIKMILYFLGYGQLEKRNENKDTFMNIFKCSRIPLSPEFTNQSDNKNPLKVTTINNFKGVLSTRTNIFNKSPKARENKQNLAFTQTFKEMLDVLHLGFSINNPVIFEGNPGQGKQTAIKYIAEMLGYEVINIVISKTTKVDDLLGKITIKRDNNNEINVNLIETKLVRALKSNNKSDDDSKKPIIVFHNLNNASSAVLAVLNTIFDQHQKDLLLPDGSTIIKGRINLVGIFNPQNGIFNRDKLPSSLIYSSIYHIVNNPDEFDILSVIEKEFEHTEFKKDFELFHKRFMKTKSIAESANSSPLTLNDIVKYKIFREVTFGKFDENIISLMIFAYRFIHQTYIDQVRDKLSLPDMKFILDIRHDPFKKILSVRTSKESEKCIRLPISEEASTPGSIQDIQLSIASLTRPQKHCLLFLICCYLSKQTCIVQGPTASGKSFLIQLFAKMLGKELNIIQLNSETGSSILTGQSILSNELTDEDVNDFHDILSQLKEVDPKFDNYIWDNFDGDPKKWKRNDFTNLRNYMNVFRNEKLVEVIDKINENKNDNEKIREYQNEKEAEEKMAEMKKIIEEKLEGAQNVNIKDQLNEMINEIKSLENLSKKLEKIRQRINELIQPAKRFHNIKSTFIKAMERGEWILLDGIELSPPEIAEKISSLCDYGDNQEFDLVECGEGYYFTRKKLPNSNQIHEDFRLFITYNPTSQIESKQIDPVLLNKCAQFTLPPIDSKPEYSAQLLLGSLTKAYPKEFRLYVSKRTADMHDFVRKESINDKDSFAGDSLITARRLKFVINEYLDYAKDTDKESPMKNIYQPIHDSLFYYYYLSHIDKECKKDNSFKDKMIKEFLKIPDADQFLNLWYEDLVINDKYTDLFTYLRNVQVCSKGETKSSNFLFTDFIEKCLLVQIMDVPTILIHIKDTLDFISKSDYDNDYLSTNLDQEFVQLKMIELIFEDIKKQMKALKEENYNLSLNDKDLLEIKELNHPLSKLILLRKFLSDESTCFSSNIPRVLFNNKFFILMKLLMRMIENDDKMIQFTEFIKILQENPSFIPLIESRIPYNLLVGTQFQMINYIMPIIKILHESEISFQIKINDRNYIFSYLRQASFEPLLTFEGNSPKFVINAEDKDIKFGPEQNDQKKIYDLLNDLINHPKESFSSILSNFLKKEGPKDKQIPHLSLLLSNKNLSKSLVANIWSILYSFSRESIYIFSKYLQCLEQETIQSFYYLFINVEKENIEQIYDFTKKMINFGNEESYLWRIKNNTYKIDKNLDINSAKKKIDQIDLEILYLEEGNEIIRQINFNYDKTLETKWLPTYIQLLESEKKPINSIIDKLIQENTNLKLREKLSKIRNKLEKAQTMNPEQSALRTKVLKQINEDIKKDLTDDIVNNYDKQITRILQCFINSFPEPMSNDQGNYLKQNIFEDIIWFSSNKHIIDTKVKSKKENIFQVILELSRYEGTECIVDLLTNRLLCNNKRGNEINDDDIIIINSMLNAQLIYRLKKSSNLNKINQLDAIFNDLEKREPMNDKLLKWIDLKEVQYPQDFELCLPKFKPIDLLFLFVGKDDNSKFSQGPLLLDISYKNREKVKEILSPYLSTNYPSANEYSNVICQRLYQDFIDKKEMTLINKETCNIIIEIAQQIDSCNKAGFKFTFNDNGFINKKWWEDKNFINSYPSLVYWMIKNPRNTIQLQDIFSNNKVYFSENRLPFSLFSLRLRSSENCIAFDCNSFTETGKYLRQQLNEIVKNHIKEKVKLFKPVETKWLNLLLPSLPFDISNPDYQMFYQFFLNISEDDTRLNPIINAQKQKEIKKFIQNVCKLIFDDTIDSYLYPKDGTLENEIAKNVFSFVLNPNDFIGSQIQLEINRLFKEVIESKDYSNLIDYLKTIKKDVNEKTSRLEATIKQEIDIRNQIYKEDAEAKQLREFNEKKKNISKMINDFNISYQILANPNPNLKFKNLQKHSLKIEAETKDFKDEFYNLDNVIDKNGDKISMICFYYKFDWSKYHRYKPKYDPYKFTCKVDIIISKDNKTESVRLSPNQKYYFFPWQINDDIKNKIDKILSYYWEIKWSECTISPISKKFEIDAYCKSKVKSVKPIIASIYFGQYISYNKFIKSIYDTTGKIISSVAILDKNLHHNIIDKTTFEIIDDSIDQTKYLINNFSVSFQDKSTCPQVQNLLPDLKTIFNQLYEYLRIINSMLKNKIDVMWKASYENSTSLVKAFLKRKYELPFPNVQTRKPYSLNLLKNVVNNDFFSNPILSVDKGSIVCCFKSLNCHIGPIVPSIYASKRARVNFISFIEESFSMQIEIVNQNQKDKYQHIFSSKGSFSNGELVQIFVSLPDEDVDIETRIHFTSEKLKELFLPCKFSFKILPLSFLISCSGQQLSFAGDAFYLCKDYLISSTILSFNIQNYYLKEKINYEYQILSQNDNTSPEPEIRINQNKLELAIPKIRDVKKLHAELKLKFSDKLITSIFINSVIIPFDFAFDVYDTDSKRYVTDTTIFFSTKYFDRDITLHFRIYGPSFYENFEGSITENLPYELYIKEFSNIDKKFIINGDKEFDIILTPNKNSYTIKSYNSYWRHSFTVTINGVQKQVYLSFKEVDSQIMDYYDINKKYVKKYLTVGYTNNTKEWNILNESSKPNAYSIIASPFSYHILNQISVSYNLDCEVIKATSNLFICVNANGSFLENSEMVSTPITKEGKKKRIYEIFDDCTKSPYFYPIYGISGGAWYPAFSIYPDMPLKELKFNEENIKIAKSNLEKFERYQDRFYRNVNFRQFNKLLYLGSVIKNISNFISYLPKEIKTKFDQLIAASKTISENDPKMIILSHNAIILFRNIFYDRYQKIKNDRFNISSSPLSQQEIDDEINVCYNVYCSVDPHACHYDIYSKTIERFDKLKGEIKKIKIEARPQNEEKCDAYLCEYRDNFITTPKKRNEQPKYIIISNSSKSSLNDMSNIQIQLPKVKFVKEFSLQTIPKLREFYDSHIKGIRLLPVFVSVMKSRNDHKMEIEATEYFNTLLQIYENLPDKDYSIISSTTNLFSESFASMIGKFKKAGVDFKNILPKKCIVPEEDYQGFIELPEKDRITPLPPERWTIYNPYQPYIPFIPEEEQPKVYYPEEEEKEDNDEYNDSDDDDNPQKLPNTNDDKPEQDDEKRDIGFVNIVDEYRSKLKNELNKNKPAAVTQEQSDKKAESQGAEPQTVFVLNNPQSMSITNDQLDGMISTFTDEMGIERALNRMENMDQNSPLKIYNTEDHKILDKSILNTSKTNFPIYKLMQQGLYFANKFFIAASEMDIPRSEFAVNILVDCSSFISDENKIFNMLIICALTHALNTIGIPYSAAVIADQEFKCIIKQFEDPHSLKYLQMICECLLIKRFRTKLATSVQFAINKMAYPKDERPYRAIFVFSDGLDEQLILPKAWSSSIFTNDKISCGFVFIKSSKLTKEKVDLLEEKWSNFENVINKSGKPKIVKIASIKAEIKIEVDDENKDKIKDEISKKLIDLFKAVMERNIDKNNKTLKVHEYENPIFSVDELVSTKRISDYMKTNFTKINKIFAKSTSVLKSAKSTIDKLNPRVYQNIIKKVLKCKLSNDVKTDALIKEFIINRINIDSSPLETVFKLNKASQLILSSTGTEFDIIALVLNLINPVPEPMIYLEERGGWIRYYSVSIVIDPSISCFDDLSGSHSLQTIQTILSSLATLDIQCFDLIIAGNPNPIIICSDVGTLYALSNKSSLYDSLFSALQKPSTNTDLASAIHTVFDLGRLRSSDYTSVLFVLTNGMYESHERERIIDSVNMCVQSGISTFGIGIGVYPKGIEKLFPQVVFSPNPSNVMKAVASLYGDNISISNRMLPITFAMPNHKDLIEAMKSLVDNAKKPIFKALVDELKDITPYLDAFDDLYNQEQEIYDPETGYKNPVGKNTEMYVKNLFNSQKILIVMLWDYTLNPDNEEHFVHPEYITKPSKEGIDCIKTAVDYYGISLTVVQNYEDAIKKLTNQTSQGLCDYYATWVFCGPPYPMLPKEKKEENGQTIIIEPNVDLVGQFNEVLIQFWKNGGSIVFWAEGEPLNYQVNLFLEEATFEKGEKTRLRIHGSHKGEGYLEPDPSGTLQKNSTFNRHPNIFKQCQRPMLSNNIGRIFEGISIGYADAGKTYPFKPFSKDSEGGISALFYPANIKEGTGDIIIDCGYTKCFTNMETDGTSRYIQNIAGWTARPEVHLIIDGKQPHEWRPKAVKFEIDHTVFWTRFLTQPIDDLNKLRRLWAIDSSESVQYNDFYHNELRKLIGPKRDGDEFYIWDNEYHKKTYEEIMAFINNREGHTGTQSHLIAEIATKSKIRDHLIIVTDGTVLPKEITLSDDEIRKNKIRFKYVTTYVICDANPPELIEQRRRNPGISEAELDNYRLKCDLSVGAPYCRGTQNKTFAIRTANSKEPMASLTAEDIKALNNISNINNFATFNNEFEKLRTAIQAATLGTENNNDISNKLDELYKRISKTIDATQKTEFENNFYILKMMAQGALRGAFTEEDIAAALRKKPPYQNSI